MIRAPVAYVRGSQRPPFFTLMTALGSVPPLSWTGLGRAAPMPVDMLARGVARIALETIRDRTVYYAGDLRRRNSREEASGVLPAQIEPAATSGAPAHPFEMLDEDTPFGWAPPLNDDAR